jgi:Predicted metal-binding integral membrane protein (DUF2182)
VRDLAAAPPFAWTRLRTFAWRHPEWWVAAVSAGAWIVLAASGGDRRAHHDADGVAPLTVAVTALMVVAMMSPLVLPTLRHIALTSLWPYRHSMQGIFLVGYVGAWTLLTLALAAATGAAAAIISRALVVAVVAVAATAWQFARRKRRALRRCARTIPLPASGWRAYRDCARFGSLSAASCAATCWGFMAVAAAAGHRIGVMMLLFAAQLRERTSRWYEPLPGAAAVAVAGAWMLAG